MGRGTAGAVQWESDPSTATTSGIAGTPMDGVNTAKDLCASNIIPGFWGSVMNPSYTTTDPAVNIANVLTNGTTENTHLLAELDLVATQLKQIPCVVTWRVMTELNGNWNWYGLVSGNGPSGGTTTPAQQIQVYQLMHDRLVADGVTNVLYVYNVNDAVGSFTAAYPGDAYVDILSYDCYSPAPACGQNSTAYAALATFKPSKPLWIYEASCTAPTGGTQNTCDNNAYLTDVIAHAPNVTAIIFWSEAGSELSTQQNALSVMTNSHSITKANLPPGVAQH
jgi:hypothetical protein